MQRRLCELDDNFALHNAMFILIQPHTWYADKRLDCHRHLYTVAGWISLLDTESGYRWACKVEASLPIRTNSIQ
jgi:hypothetical protein